MFQHGITEDRAELRAHVCWNANRVYIFRTEDVRRALNGPVATASQSGIETARGRLVKPGDIPGCTAIPITSKQWARYYVPKTADESEKGRRAEALVCEILALAGLEARRVRDTREQRAGVDLEYFEPATGRRRTVQVKCDFEGGGDVRDPRCTGNLFIQTHERNPFGKH